MSVNHKPSTTKGLLYCVLKRNTFQTIAFKTTMDDILAAVEDLMGLFTRYSSYEIQEYIFDLPQLVVVLKSVLDRKEREPNDNVGTIPDNRRCYIRIQDSLLGLKNLIQRMPQPMADIDSQIIDDLNKSIKSFEQWNPHFYDPLPPRASTPDSGSDSL